MPKFQTERIIDHSAEEMFDLVADVEQYPEFVPFCESIVVRARQPETDGLQSDTVLIVDMTVGYKLVRETFTSRVQFDRPGLTIRADYLDGPFRSMENVWTFESLGPSQSRVNFKIEYEFRSRALSMLMGTLFDKVFRRFAFAFEARASEIYG